MFSLVIPSIAKCGQRPVTTLDLERYVNDGSPSGYTFQDASSTPTTAWSGLPSFQLPLVAAEIVRECGEPQELGGLEKSLRAFCPVHPDVLPLTGYNIILDPIAWKHVNVVPTSSPRVVLAAPNWHFALKLNYPRCLGRFPRQLTWEQAETSVGVSTYARTVEFEHTVLLAEPYAVQYRLRPALSRIGSSEHVVIVRDCKLGAEERIVWAIPGFAMLARERLGFLENPLVFEVAEPLGIRPAALLGEGFVATFFRSVDELVVKAGIWPECTAQNCFFAMRESGKPCIIWRDCQGFFRDAELLAEFGKKDVIDLSNYHLLAGRDAPMWRSYLFDDLISRHIVDPCLKLFETDGERRKMERLITSVGRRSLVATSSILPKESYGMCAKKPKPNERLGLHSMQKPFWR